MFDFIKPCFKSIITKSNIDFFSNSQNINQDNNIIINDEYLDISSIEKEGEDFFEDISLQKKKQNFLTFKVRTQQFNTLSSTEYHYSANYQVIDLLSLMEYTKRQSKYNVNSSSFNVSKKRVTLVRNYLKKIY